MSSPNDSRRFLGFEVDINYIGFHGIGGHFTADKGVNIDWVVSLANLMAAVAVAIWVIRVFFIYSHMESPFYLNIIATSTVIKLPTISPVRAITSKDTMALLILVILHLS
jgi:hypothetical protein